jgi:hypothetical protein
MYDIDKVDIIKLSKTMYDIDKVDIIKLTFSRSYPTIKYITVS